MHPFQFSRPNSQASSMASLRGKALSLLFCLFFFSPPSVLASRSFRSDSSKVSLALYYESLCPYSANFIVSYLEKLFEDDLISIVDLKLVPWGNAKILGNDTFKCQHGPYECLLNTVEACAIHVLPKQEEHFPFIDCVESLVYQRKYSQWESCFEKLGLDPKPISDCYSSGYGKELELQYAAETNDLQPPHEYVPWVVVNGQPLFEEYQDFISYICEAYKGTKVLEACSEVFLDTVQEREANKHRNPVMSYKEDTMILSLSARARSAVTSLMQQMKIVASM